MELSPKNLPLSTSTSRERLYPTSSFAFPPFTRPFQEHSLPHSEYATTSPVTMTDHGDPSEAGPPSHETSESPPPAKRTRLSFKSKTPGPSTSASPPPNRVQTRSRSAALASSASSSVAGDAQVFTPLNIPDVDPASGAPDSRASSEFSALAPTTRSKKRKVDQLESHTLSVNGEPIVQASASQDVADENEGASEPEPEDQDQDQDQEPTYPKRGRPAGKGKGGRRGGGRGRGKGAALTRQNSGAPETARKPGGRGGRGKKTSANHMVQVSYDRQAHLKQNFKEVAKMVRWGLDVLAEKSLEMVQDDPTYYREVPEYEKTMNDLDAVRDSVLAQQGKLYDMKVEHMKKLREMNEDYTQREFQVSRQLQLPGICLTNYLVQDTRLEGKV
jgi:hypothetical protein